MTHASFSLTLAIPTYNGAQRLPDVLEALLHQTQNDQSNIEPILWDIIIIDNNSTDTTQKVVKKYQQNWSKNHPLQYYFEPNQGLAFARERAIKEAQGTYIAFLDDDNIPAPDWIYSIYQFSQNYPQAGAFSGQIHGEYEIQPPENFQKIATFLAIREHGSEPFRFDPDNLRLPPGAGLVVKKQAWQDAVPKTPQVVGNQGDILARGDDYAPLLYLHKQGWEIWYNPRMHINHKIPAFRLEQDYLLSLARACGLATCQLRMINASPNDKLVIILRTILGNLRRIIKHYIQYQGKLQSDLIPAFEMEFYRASLMSVFHWMKQIRNKQ
ncbi:hormogonium polysaccharide biosynthesis glycosyltransferase HpsE [Spirulina subsalsa FACHB-351]|uniref:Hormogonium polysaccharide biosynthesis glycosyltransferase HpsE n=1 Tax=Spirulina subsalsa FACHB-351 TaxID=234711 RepID=A0ABT3L7V5_9CYAN|nr:hormogonium polysaccharide biosynthesis glycosyltransferase HpsE [Spirulina subsalsa]MCW6037045.1 hormogonium polysaccharide biosynthesis glycosyltransferase HpsE [Spirulina subsalsa FACHB-351]